MDISRFDILAGSESGRVMKLVHPGTNQVLIDPETKEPFTITLRGRHSAIARDVLKGLQDESAAMVGQEGRQLTHEERVSQNARYLAALTVAWSFTTWTRKAGGEPEPFPCTPSNAEAFWRDSRFPHFREQALNFVASDGNFMPA